MSGTVLPMLNFHQIPKSKLPRPSPKTRRKKSSSAVDKSETRDKDDDRKVQSDNDKDGSKTKEGKKDAENDSKDKVDDKAEHDNDGKDDDVDDDDNNDSKGNSNKDANKGKGKKSSLKLPRLSSPRSMTVRMGKYQSYKMFRPSFAFGFTAAHQLAMTQTYQSHNQRGGLDFYTLARWVDRLLPIANIFIFFPA